MRGALINNDDLGGSEVVVTTSEAKAAPATALKEITPPADQMKNYPGVEAALVFTRDDKRNITGLVLQQNGMMLPAARVKPPPSGAAK
ncbi:MAG TPA: hypothetical protein VGE39_22045 [Prosthecobacter sp.]